MSDFFGTIIGGSLAIVLVVSWFTHVITCLTTASWGFLIAGAIMFPIGIIHGFLILIGVM